jgi:hypothetical protein
MKERIVDPSAIRVSEVLAGALWFVLPWTFGRGAAFGNLIFGIRTAQRGKKAVLKSAGHGAIGRVKARHS